MVEFAEAWEGRRSRSCCRAAEGEGEEVRKDLFEAMNMDFAKSGFRIKNELIPPLLG